MVLSLNGVYGYGRAISENDRCSLLMQDTQSASENGFRISYSFTLPWPS
jgi:hypothetical protein